MQHAFYITVLSWQQSFPLLSYHTMSYWFVLTFTSSFNIYHLSNYLLTKICTRITEIFLVFVTQTKSFDWVHFYFQSAYGQALLWMTISHDQSQQCTCILYFYDTVMMRHYHPLHQWITQGNEGENKIAAIFFICVFYKYHDNDNNAIYIRVPI